MVNCACNDCHFFFFSSAISAFFLFTNCYIDGPRCQQWTCDCHSFCSFAFFYLLIDSSSSILMAKVPDKERNKLSVALPVLGEVLCGQVTPYHRKNGILNTIKDIWRYEDTNFPNSLMSRCYRGATKVLGLKSSSGFHMIFR